MIKQRYNNTKQILDFYEVCYRDLHICLFQSHKPNVAICVQYIDLLILFDLMYEIIFN